MFVLGPVGVPIIIVGLNIEGGIDGTNQFITELAVDEVPVAKSVGLKHVKV